MLRSAQAPRCLRRLFSVWFLAAALALTPGCRERGDASAAPARDVGLFTSLPILWNEYAELSELLKPEGNSHWALETFRRQGRVVPLDRLTPIPAELGLLVMAQPRPLSPDENIALDEWVRGGGKLLLFADPMLTQHSAFAIGDRRRPEAMVLLSPILTRWGLTLRFDEAQPAGEREVELFGQSVPVNLPGSFSLADGSGACRLHAEGLAVRCRIGKGTVLAVADAALLEPQPEGGTGNREAALEALLDSAFAN